MFLLLFLVLTTNKRGISLGYPLHLLVQSSGSSSVLYGVFPPEQDNGVGHKASGENTMAGVQTFFEAFLNMSGRSTHFIDEACF